ncbi:hypothetical protein G647_02474 [Cladophialophora carrionii CBS 160.54]|uniref:Epoxide hydrolase N-terminal domain-containing protein n=1 Tax=Cladophialophora carrionii CBS 160.54 TaxID=1279043 RepID=V9DFR0_9EURO|nr:uncharacterized protein G647_02474 [Cladophialophora carrionii CBS 160.54]ETI25700.1 hypothetical protein G647_02474 [Cladophialophora carrionii CBS 160.54]
MSGYDTIPQGANIQVDKFTLSIPDQELQDFKDLLRLSKLAPKTYENLHANAKDGKFGVSHEWMSKAKDFWLNEYDWRATEKHNNSFPNFIAHVKDDNGDVFKIHFIALFSKKENAVPLLYMHGWPGSHFEHLDIFDLYRNKYSPEELPYHTIAVSLPGWTLSSGPPLDRDFDTEDIARIMNKLMIGLGFGSGYICQGGDIGSFTSKVIAGTYDECKDNFAVAGEPPKDVDESKITDTERQGMERMKAFYMTGNGYAREHGTRPATIGFVLASSPLAQLAWIGEKFQEWTDETPPLTQILDSITLYWFTESFPRCIYCYREFSVPGSRGLPHGNPKYNNDKPVAYSWFPKELAPVPREWVEKQGHKLVLFRQHKSGGHFAAMEKPKEMLEDMEEFIKTIGWPVK